MGMLFAVLSIWSILFYKNFAHAESLFKRRTANGSLLFDVLIRGGMDKEATSLLFRMFDFNEGRIPNTTYSVIVDYALPSVLPRFHLLNLVTGQVESFHVSHGINSGVLHARRFSNRVNSWQSSLGFFYAQGQYISDKNGLSLALDGLDKSNSNAKYRAIVLHGARYVSDEFVRRNGRLGWSEGCLAVNGRVINYLINRLSQGSIILAYHHKLMAISRRFPDYQSLSGEEEIPPGVNTRRDSAEGGFKFNFSWAQVETVLD